MLLGPHLLLPLADALLLLSIGLFLLLVLLHVFKHSFLLFIHLFPESEFLNLLFGVFAL